jgi:U5 snRNP protein, DIM1 family
MSYLLPHLHSGWEVDQAILSEEDRVVVIRFGRDDDATCMVQDEILVSIAEKVRNFAVIYLVDLEQVPDFNGMYELYEPCVMFFFRNKHIMVDHGTGGMCGERYNWRYIFLLLLLLKDIERHSSPLDISLCLRQQQGHVFLGHAKE